MLSIPVVVSFEWQHRYIPFAFHIPSHRKPHCALLKSITFASITTAFIFYFSKVKSSFHLHWISMNCSTSVVRNDRYCKYNIVQNIWTLIKHIIDWIKTSLCLASNASSGSNRLSGDCLLPIRVWSIVYLLTVNLKAARLHIVDDGMGHEIQTTKSPVNIRNDFHDSTKYQDYKIALGNIDPCVPSIFKKPIHIQHIYVCIVLIDLITTNLLVYSHRKL